MWVLYCLLIALFSFISAQYTATPQYAEKSVKNGTADASWMMPPPFGFPSFPPPLPFPPPFPYPPPFPMLPPFPFPPPPPPLPLPPLDPFVCTLDATILVVLHGPRLRPIIPVMPPPATPIGAPRNKRNTKKKPEKSQPDPEVGMMPPCMRGYPGPCGNAVRIRCAETAVADILTCTTCCRLATKVLAFPREAIHGVLIDSAQLPTGRHLVAGANNRKKRVAPAMPAPIVDLPLPPSCASMNPPCPTLKCMCCGPRLPFPQFNPFLPPLPPPVPLPVPIPFGPVPPPIPIGPPPPPVPFGPMPFGPGPLGPMPFGPGPLGPMPFGPGPLGPMPFGPGPLGPIPMGPGPIGPIPFAPPFPAAFPPIGQANPVAANPRPTVK